MSIQSFKDLIIWQKGMELVERIYAITASFPKEEMYGLSSQMRKAAVSVPSNIAEGFRRKHSKEYQQFLAITLGSLGELETQVEIANRLQYLKQTDNSQCQHMIEELCKMTNGLLSKIKRTVSS